MPQLCPSGWVSEKSESIKLVKQGKTPQPRQVKTNKSKRDQQSTSVEPRANRPVAVSHEAPVNDKGPGPSRETEGQTDLDIQVTVNSSDDEYQDDEADNSSVNSSLSDSESGSTSGLTQTDFSSSYSESEGGFQVRPEHLEPRAQR